jgi:hypothetical protein
MKRHDWFLVIATLSFSFLFYKEQAGLNFLLFSCIVIGCLVGLHPPLWRMKSWWYFTACHLVTACCVFYHTSTLSSFAYIVSLLVLTSKSVSLFQSVIMSMFFGVYSVAASVVLIILDIVKRFEFNNTENKSVFPLKKMITIGVSGVIVVFFFLLYQHANPLFNEATKYINFDWLSIEWCFFTLWGFLVAYGLLKSKTIHPLANADRHYNSKILKQESYPTTYFDELLIVKWVFILLNVMLLVLNVLDVYQLYINPQLPKGITLSDFVHQAIGSLIFSIVLALTMISICFRGELNFLEKVKPIRYLIYGWVAQNVMMIISAIVRNWWYIDVYALTYLRIGVFVYLGMALVGLILTAYKIKTLQRVWALTRLNIGTWFLALCLSTMVDWDKLIADFNLLHAHQLTHNANVKKVKLDRRYISSFSSTTLPQQILQTPMYLNPYNYEVTRRSTDVDALSNSLINFYETYHQRTWKSWSLRDERLHQEIQSLQQQGLLKSLALPYRTCSKRLLTSYFGSIEHLVIQVGNDKLEEIAKLPYLKSLCITDYNQQDLAILKTNKSLETLFIYSNYDSKLIGLESLQQLKTVRLRNVSTNQLSQLKALRHLKTLIVESNSAEFITHLQKELPDVILIIKNPSYENYR